MKNLFIFCFMLLTSCVMATAQTKLTAVEQQMIIKKVESASQTMKSMQCDFTQTKTMKLLKKDMQSKGVMFFQRPDRFAWLISDVDIPKRHYPSTSGLSRNLESLFIAVQKLSCILCSSFKACPSCIMFTRYAT